MLIAERDKFVAGLAKAGDEARVLGFFHGFLLSGSFSGHSGLAGENELGDVGESDGVTAGDALASKLPDEIAEEEIDLIGGGETVDVVEKLGGEDFRIHNGNACAETVGVVDAESRARSAIRGTMVLVDQHVAAVAFGADVLAMGIDGGANWSAEVGGHG